MRWLAYLVDGWPNVNFNEPQRLGGHREEKGRVKRPVFELAVLENC